MCCERDVDRMAFSERLDDAGLAFFNEINTKPFSQQAVAFLNAYWGEVGNQAEFIFSVSYDILKKTEMYSKGISLLHQYKEGTDMDFDIGLYYYEQMCKYLEDGKDAAKWAGDQYRMSRPEMMTSIQRKKELREKVDVNFDGRISFLEYLLYQYQEVANPADFVHRTQTVVVGEHPDVAKARLALEEVNKHIQEYEAEKHRLEEKSQQGGVKGLGAKNELAQIESSPLMENLRKGLITAEAAVRIATKKHGGSVVTSPAPGGAQPSGAKGESTSGGGSQGAVWWMNRDLEEKKKLYAHKGK